MVSPDDVAWSVLKASPEDSLYTEEMSRVGSGAYGDPALTPAVVQNRLQTMHPAIRGMMNRGLQYGSTPRQKHMGRIEGYGKGNIRYPAPREGMPVIEDVPTIDMPYYPEEGFPHSMGPLGDVSIRSGAGAPEHLPVDRTRLPSFGQSSTNVPDASMGGRYPKGHESMMERQRGREELNVFRGDEHAPEVLGNQGPRSFAETMNAANRQDAVHGKGGFYHHGLDPGFFPNRGTFSRESPAEGTTYQGYGDASGFSGQPYFDPEQFGRSIFDYDMRDE
jgi:hypothetical protein